ncbi:hypothetical protein QBC38DRAFT_191135 [Podospora fimiseda]|uniref:Fungal N-terminal domain-containing protein n=1 Tax=Podospora fimiseda TaxID=252190 RepID=A0AAN6YK26_9PEZI|nr:hypothetical protein QBC38DRAFT_191135 [Podospora fimiseda]
MDGLGAAASVIAVIELTAKLISLCLEYSSAVKNAKADIKRLRNYTEILKMTAEDAQKLLQDPHGPRLKLSQKVDKALVDIRSQLNEINTTLEAKLGKGQKLMRRIGFRALKWPFESKDMDKIIANLKRGQDSFTAALQIDQTYVQIRTSNSNLSDL